MFSITISGGSRISPRRGRQLPGGCQHTILPNFSKNCMKLKEFGPSSKILLCKSATDYVWIGIYSVSINRYLLRGSNENILCITTTGNVIVARYVSGRSKGGCKGRTLPPGSKFFQFHAVFGKIRQTKLYVAPPGS